MNGKISNLAQVAYVRKYTMDGGKENGTKIIEVNNGNIRFLLNASKALDVTQLWHKGTNISFLSKNGFTYRETPFLNRFEGGMIYTCGLDSVGGRDGFELHGSIHNCPAEIVECKCDEDGITVVGITYDTSLFGKNLALKRTVKTQILGDSISIEDEIINNGTKDQEYAILYHVNLGYPMLDEGTVVKSDAVTVTPRNEYSKQRLSDREVFTSNVDNEEERCYFIKNKTPIITVENKKLNKTFTLEYTDDTLPHFIQWCSSASQDYALGVEASSTLLDDGFKYSVVERNKSVKLGLKITIK